MKQLSILFVVLIFFSSCGSSKIEIQNSENEVAKSESAVKTKTEETSNEKYLDEIIDNKNEIEEIIPLPPEPPMDEGNIKESIHNRWDNILKKYVSENGEVDYLSLKGSFEFDVYIDILIQNVPNDTWTREEVLVYWINAYNAFTVDLILRNYPIKSIKDIKNPWEQRLWKLGDKWYNLNDIEHQILRKMDEPRIHFAIVCASFSCPKLQNEAFTATALEQQLTKATKEFLADSNRNTITDNSINLSKIFQWFSKDFKQNGSLIDFLNTYSEVEISSKAKISYKDYNWDLNE